jgi:uncharacterized membrane protein
MAADEETIFDRLDEHARIIVGKIEDFGRLSEESLKRLGYHVLAVAVFLCVLFAVYILAAPFLIKSADQRLVNLGAVPYIFAALSYMCHQMPERSLTVSGVPYPVCARDVGIYVGAALGVLVPIFVRKSRTRLATIKLFLIAFIPIALDGVSQTIMGLRESSNALRLFTGLIFGFGVVAYAASKILLKNEKLAGVFDTKEGLAVSITGTVFFAYILYSALTTQTDLTYVTPEQAKKTAKDFLASGEEPLVYYVPPQAPATIQADKFLSKYDDCVLSDISGMTWAKREYNIILGYGNLSDTPLNERHRLGVWAVVFPEGRESSGRFVYSNAPGDYVYVDAWTGGVIEKIKH